LTTKCGKCCAVLGLLWGIMGVKINKMLRERAAI
jgi:hypothetical protein